MREILRFGAVGAAAYVTNVGIFNFLVHWGSAPMHHYPLRAQILSGVLSILLAYAGNKHWTWRDRTRGRYAREITIFFIFNIIAIGFATLCLGFSRYVLGLNSALSDNVSANIIGVGVGTVARFFVYRKWIFTKIEIES